MSASPKQAARIEGENSVCYPLRYGGRSGDFVSRAGERPVAEYRKSPAELLRSPRCVSAMIDVQDLVKNFGDFCAVDHVSFAVPEGQIFAFLGPNGAGKTTTIKMLTTVLQPTSGMLRVDGHDPQREQRQVRRSFGIVFQDPSLDNELTAVENMELHGVLYGVPSVERRKRIESLLRFVELWDRRSDYVKFYSGGMRRRLEVARALLHKPKILFLDEPTLGLDPQTRNHIWAFIQSLSKERESHRLLHHPLHG